MAFRNPVTSLPASGIVGKITASQIESVDALQVSGKITASQIDTTQLTVQELDTNATGAGISLLPQSTFFPNNGSVLEFRGPSYVPPPAGQKVTKAPANITGDDTTLLIEGVDDGITNPPYIQLTTGETSAVPYVKLVAGSSVLTIGPGNGQGDGPWTFTGDVHVNGMLYNGKSRQTGTLSVPALSNGQTWRQTVNFGQTMNSVPSVVASCASYRYIAGATSITTSGADITVANYSGAAGAACDVYWIAETDN